MQVSIFHLILSLVCYKKYTKTVIILNFATAALLALLENVCMHILSFFFDSIWILNLYFLIHNYTDHLSVLKYKNNLLEKIISVHIGFKLIIYVPENGQNDRQ